MAEKVLLKVEGMDCANCASTISRTLTKEGLKDVNVDFISGEVTFNETGNDSVSSAVNSINKLGYRVRSRSDETAKTEDAAHHDHDHTHEKIDWKFFTCLLLTIPLVLHMVLPFPILHEPWFQLALSMPVMIIGTMHFGRSAFLSLRAGVPNMDVLIFIGSTAAFIYSLAGMIIHSGSPDIGNYMFFETGATIITLVLLGNLIEHRSVKQTTSAIAQLTKLQPRTARRILTVNGTEQIIECKIEDLRVGDMVMINSGDRIPADGKVTEGKGIINESMLTGESKPVFKSFGDIVTSGTVMDDGNIRFVVDHELKDNAISKIIELVRAAQHSKPAIQRLGDRISAIFVPAVLLISAVTFVASVFIFGISATRAMMNSIAVLVISCPCAMGLATPTAVMVGIGRGARNGILIKGGSTVEQLSGIRTIVFDKTGTLTTGKFKIKNINCIDFDEKMIRPLLFSLEQNSSHPIALAIQNELKEYSSNSFRWKDISEDKGIGINATDSDNNLYSAGSFQMVKHLHQDHSHDIYVLKNNKLIATVDLEDELKTDVRDTIDRLKNHGIRVLMLSGDRQQKCEAVALATGITEFYYEKLPAEKLQILDRLLKEGPVAMVGDGINDAPALAKATVGISISNATEAAIQSAQVILLDRHDLGILWKALRIGEATYLTIKQNLFWAFLYNVIAIPIAAAGFLSPMVGALSMAFSDVIVIGNSLRLRAKKIW